MATPGAATAKPVDLKLEVVLLGVADVDRAKAFYQKLGWRLDGDFAGGDGWRVVQVTPHHSDASVIFGTGIAAPKPGAANGLILAVADLDAARADLIARGVAVSGVFHYAAGLLAPGAGARVAGRDPQGRSYFSFASFEDPDGNGWLLQEVTARLPGREWTPAADVGALAELLRETSQHHDPYEKSLAPHHWSEWYAPYMSARQGGRSPQEAEAAAVRHVAERVGKKAT
jgi:catechol 2,3-dioxygenase-like lactoylglutathione lyase family enzyme